MCLVGGGGIMVRLIGIFCGEIFGIKFFIKVIFCCWFSEILFCCFGIICCIWLIWLEGRGICCICWVVIVGLVSLEGFGSFDWGDVVLELVGIEVVMMGCGIIGDIVVFGVGDVSWFVLYKIFWYMCIKE